MEHNLEDSIKLESGIVGMDFDHVEAAAEITLESSSHGEDIPMEFETMQDKQHILMDTGSEEVIDFMGEQFALQEYSIGDDQTTEITTTEESNIQNILQSQSDTMVDLQYEPQSMTPVSIRQDNQGQPKYIAVKVAMPSTAGISRRGEPAVLNAVSRQVAIAPKPPKLVQTVARNVFPAGKQFAIAPKPITLISNKSGLTKVPISGVVQANASKGNTVLAQVGKQLIMVPAGSQKIKLVSANQAVQFVKGDPEQAHITPKRIVTTSQGTKSVMTKVVVQGANQPAVITKLLPSGSTAAPQTRYVMQQKKIPISIGNNKVLLTSPTKQGKKQQVITLNPPSLTPIQPQGSTTKKVVITANPNKQKVILKAAPQKTAQLSKDGKLVLHPGQRSQLHKIDVPGKGVQFIRLITNPSSGSSTAKQSSVLNISKSIVSVTDRGMSGKPQQKFVRIAPAPVGSKPQASQQIIRSGQSLLTPMSSVERSVEPVTCKQEPDEHSDEEEEEPARNESECGASLAALVADAVAGGRQSPIQDENTNSMDQIDSSYQTEEHPLIVIPANYLKHNNSQEDKVDHTLIDMKFDSDAYNSFQSPTTPPHASDSDVASNDLASRPRKACNCTKSQCLKLYCDCFANGEFCNRCNCNNCHNNLENEELRQKSIRACLMRNPNAFRPKIGKAKAGGPEIIRRHNKGCNCKRSGCLKNYCECYEAKIACTAMCKCVGCRNVEEGVSRRMLAPAAVRRDTNVLAHLKQPCSFMTSEVIEAVCQCLLAAAGDCADPARDVLDEFARCLQDIIGASLHSTQLEAQT
ncbi:protein lin-54 homolog isoform X1 [Amyelois transitella]|uniref:protein lin-54 homolog isoform X1 n=1 Tax=Amyelois transitella TaxID=680683 RepID=UPI0029906D40|nr:protein lin-54 homolog isoform X1 [Amyelois transitella]